VFEWTILDSNKTGPESSLSPCHQEAYGLSTSDGNQQGAAKSAAVQYPHGPALALSSELVGLLQRLAKSLTEQAAIGLAELADLWPALTAADQQALIQHAHTLAAMRATPLGKKGNRPKLPRHNSSPRRWPRI
jgi:hypothetical protein